MEGEIMPETMPLEEYKELTKDLPFVQPLGECCGKPLMETVHIEPLEGRNTLEVERTCILKCSGCGKEYLSKWD